MMARTSYDPAGTVALRRDGGRAMTAQLLHLADMTAADWAVCATAATVLGLAVRDVRRQMRGDDK